MSHASRSACSPQYASTFQSASPSSTSTRCTTPSSNPAEHRVRDAHADHLRRPRPRRPRSHPSHNGAAPLMLFQSAAATSAARIRPAQMLVRHGSGVLLFSGRRTSSSNSTPDSCASFGGAPARLGFFATPRHGQPGHVGPLSLSSGTDITRSTSQPRSRGMSTVVTDGTAANSFKLIRKSSHRAPLTRVDTGSGPRHRLSSPCRGSPARTHRSPARSPPPRPLQPDPHAGEVEKSWGDLYDRAGGERSQLWYLPNATHTGALRQYPRAYERRVVAFFDDHLG